jgi:hypothetical protein
MSKAQRDLDVSRKDNAETSARSPEPSRGERLAWVRAHSPHDPSCRRGKEGVVVLEARRRG